MNIHTYLEESIMILTWSHAGKERNIVPCNTNEEAVLCALVWL